MTKAYVRATRFCKLVLALQEDAYCYAELAEMSGLSMRTVQEWVSEMHGHRLVFVGAWQRHPGDLGHARRAWRWRTDEKQRNAEKPRSRTRQEIAKASRQRVKARRLQSAFTGVQAHG